MRQSFRLRSALCGAVALTLVITSCKSHKPTEPSRNTWDYVDPAASGYRALALADDNHIIAAGLASYQGSMLLSKIDLSGNLTWNRTQDYPYVTQAYGIAPFSRGFICAAQTSHDATSYSRPIAAFVDQQGNLLWTQEVSDFTTGWCNAAAAGQGRVYVAAYVRDPDLDDHFAVVCFNRFGTTLWSRILPTDMGVDAQSICVTTDSGAAVAGWGPDYNGCVVIKLTASGDTAWSRRVSASQAYGVVAPAAGGVTVAGDKGGNTLLQHFSDAGDSLWAVEYPESGTPFALATTSDGGYVTVGVRNPGANGQQAFIMTMNSSGALEWFDTVERGNLLWLFAVLERAPREYLVAGIVEIEDNTDQHGIVCLLCPPDPI